MLKKKFKVNRKNGLASSISLGENLKLLFGRNSKKGAGVVKRAQATFRSRMKKRNFCFVDLFSGCGGLSLGLLNAGWKGLFAVEQSPMAFQTLQHNLIDKREHCEGQPKFSWPEWLEIKSYEINSFSQEFRTKLRQLRGTVDLVAGGPPCQGFSFAGKRNKNDPRNGLFKHHLEIVDLIRPTFVLMENVQGIDTAFGIGNKGENKGRGRKKKSYADKIRKSLEKHGYEVQQHVFRAADFGVPQFRPRYFTLGIKKEALDGFESPNLKETLLDERNEFLKSKNLPVHRSVTVAEAISDLCTKGKILMECMDSESPPGFLQIDYERPESPYQHLMHKGLKGRLWNSLRLVNHNTKTIVKFKEIQSTCRKGVQLTPSDRKRLGIKKSVLTPLSGSQASHTLTTLPDDLLHYMEPRIHSVREHARLQSFPDWFEFKGKFTTGGDKRTKECPRYTQVGNAVPPLLAEAVGKGILSLANQISELNMMVFDVKYSSKYKVPVTKA